MNSNMIKRNELLAQTVIKGLQSRNMSGYYAATREEALSLALSLIPEGSTATMGGGVSVEKDEPGRFTDYKPTRIPTETPKLPEPFKSLEETWSY